MRGLGLGLGLSRQGGGGVSYEPEAAALFARMTSEPDATRKGQINTLIKSLKTAGIWTKLDALYVFAAHNNQAARLNWVADQYNATVQNAPTFTTDRGYAGDGASSYIDSGFNPATAVSPKFVQDSGHLGVWIGSNVASSTETDCGNSRARTVTRSASDTLTLVANASAGDTPALPAATSIGWTCWSRDNSTSYKWAKNNSAPTSVIRSSGSVISSPFFALGHSGTSSTLTSPSTRRQAALHFGSSLSDAQFPAFHAALSAYMTAIGAP